MKSGAFFDLDGTLVRGESQALLLRHLRRLGRAPLSRILPLALGMAAYSCGALRDPAPLRRRAVQLFRGWQVKAAEGFLEGFFRSELLARFDTRVVNRLRDHAALGCDVFLLSAAVEPLVRLAGDYLGVRESAGTHLDVADGAYTGRILGYAPWGERKVQCLLRLCEDHGIDPRLSWAYADHGSDVAFLSVVGHPIAVNPDHVLLAAARQRGWEVLWTL